MRAVLLLALPAVLATAPTSLAAGPRIVSVDAAGPARLHEAVDLRVVVRAADGPVTGVRLSLPDLQGVFVQSACRVGRPARSAAAGTASFRLPYRPAWVGFHLLELAVTAGGCSAATATSRRTIGIDVAAGPPAEPQRAPVATRRPCPGADLLPLRRRLRALRQALACLIDREREAHGLAPLRAARALRAAASLQAHHLVRSGRVEHRGARGVSLGARLRAAVARIRSGGENVGTAPGRMATPRSIAAAWMASPPLRRNLLDPRFARIGIGVVARAAALPQRSGATYVAALADGPRRRPAPLRRR